MELGTEIIVVVIYDVTFVAADWIKYDFHLMNRYFLSL